MARSTPARPRPSLDSQRLEEMALRYVGRFATSRAKLLAYLERKVRERGWSDQREPDLDRLANRLCELGYVDDVAYALSKSRTLSDRGYGKRRLEDSLRVAGIAEEDSAEARDLADRRAVAAAIRYAERRRIGPFGQLRTDRKQREKAIAAMVRAGHPFTLARTILDWPPDMALDPKEIADRSGLTLS